MLVLVSAVLLLQSAGTPPPAPPLISTDSAAVAAASRAADSTRQPRRSPITVAVTAEHRRTAFDDPASRDLLTRARETRMRQDTAIIAYDATTYQRVSAGLGLRRIGRERLIFRQEEATRVRWQRGEGAVIDVLGSRQVTPSGGGVEIRADVDAGVGTIPYYPGQETLWLGSGMARPQAIDDADADPQIAHPLADGAEAYYKYAIGDLVTFRLPGGRTIQLRELRVRPREPRWNLAVGSLWFDAANAQLVRAVYRLAVPIELWNVVKEADPDDYEEIPVWVRRSLNPLRATVKAVTVEYGLEAGNFWLPRLNAAEAEAEIGFMRMPMRFEQRFRYTSVNGQLDSLPPIPSTADIAQRSAADSLWRDSLRALPRDVRDSVRAARRAGRRNACDTGTVRTSTGSEFDGNLRVLRRIPCDTVALATSAALPASIFDEGDELFDGKAQAALVEAALTLGAQPEWSPQPPVVRYGLGDGLLRYNRVEGISPAVGVDAQLGRGYTAAGLVRIGTADWQPNAELALARSDGRRTVRGALFRRLVAANDWGEPLAFGNSLSALLFGRDEGLYYRSWGAEVTGTGGGAGDFAWRLFAERHDAARVETHFALWNQIRGEEFPPNILARDGTVAGVGARYTRTVGVDPRGLRLLADVRGEGGVGDFGYGRALADLTLSRPLVGAANGALTLSGGSSVGTVPPQRLFYLGGPHSIRGQDAGAAAGDAFWMARAELGTNAMAVRPVLFYDVGWAGARSAWHEPGRLASGAGAGLSVLDGFVRFDVARGIAPEQQWRVDMYLEARF